jgi:hypothetical protein
MKVKNTKLGQQILGTFTAVPLDVLRKSVEFVCSVLQQCMHNAGVCVDI